MAVTHTIDGDVVIFVLDGQNSLEEAEAAFRAAFASVEGSAKYSVLIDARTSLRHRDLGEVSVFAELLTTYRSHIKGRVALVMDENRPKPMELERRLAGFSIREKIEFALFYDLAAARSWVEELAGV